MTKFTQIPDSLRYPPEIKGELVALHIDIIEYVSNHFHNTYRYRNKVVNLLNTVSYKLINHDTLPKLDFSDIFSNDSNFEFVEDDVCCECLVRLKSGSLYLSDRLIDWDIESSTEDITSAKPVDSAKPVSTSAPISSPIIKPVRTPKTDLYIRPPVVPQIDVNKVWAACRIDDITYTIYTSLPEIPTKQNEISVTTDIRMMTDSDLLNLYPNQFIPTRAPVMYSPVDGITLHPVVGNLIPVSGYSEEELLSNIIRYPHIFRLLKEVDGQLSSFYNTIEIDGQLYDTLSVWDSLPEASIIPKTSEFLKEYVVRRYLLERDVKGVSHKYALYGTLDPFLTLFTTPQGYSELGYPDSIEIVKQCVKARVSYKQSRNPVLRRIQNA